MSNFQWKIKKCYLLDAYDSKILTEKPFVIGNDWDKEEYKYSYNLIKKKIRLHLSDEQDDICVYCRLPITFGGKGEHLDHLLSKSAYPHLMFSPYNLVLACKDCNISKTNKEVLSRFRVNTLLVPIFSFNYKIINPYFDDFSNYITLENGMFYRALDDYKGYNTILLCDLWDPVYAHKWALKNNIDKKQRTEKVAFRLEDPNITDLEKKHLTNYALRLVQRYKD